MAVVWKSRRNFHMICQSVKFHCDSFNTLGILNGDRSGPKRVKNTGIDRVCNI